jgi:hypothetical protein
LLNHLGSHVLDYNFDVAVARFRAVWGDAQDHDGAFSCLVDSILHGTIELRRICHSLVCWSDHHHRFFAIFDGCECRHR